MTVEDIDLIDRMHRAGSSFEEIQEEIGVAEDAVSLVISVSALVQHRYHMAAAELAADKEALYIYSALREAQAARQPIVNISDVKSLDDELAMLTVIQAVRALDLPTLKKLLKTIRNSRAYRSLYAVLRR